MTTADTADPVPDTATDAQYQRKLALLGVGEAITGASAAILLVTSFLAATTGRVESEGTDCSARHHTGWVSLDTGEERGRLSLSCNHGCTAQLSRSCP